MYTRLVCTYIMVHRCDSALAYVGLACIYVDLHMYLYRYACIRADRVDSRVYLSKELALAYYSVNGTYRLLPIRAVTTSMSLV